MVVGGVVIQIAAIITANEERFVRIFTKRLSISSNLIHLFNSADVQVALNLIVKSSLALLRKNCQLKTVHDHAVAKLENVSKAFKKLVRISSYYSYIIGYIT